MENGRHVLRATANEFRPRNFKRLTPPDNISRSPPPPPLTTPTRTLLLSLVPYHVKESTIRRDMELFGDIRAVEMERVREGLVVVHFYDLRHAYEAWLWIQEQHKKQQLQHCGGSHLLSSDDYASPPPLQLTPGLVDGCAVWAQFTLSNSAGNNQGTLDVVNLSSDITTRSLKETFKAFGVVRDVCESPSRKNIMFVEFYDTRHASEALINMDGKKINGNTLTVQYSGPKDNLKNVPPPSIAKKQLEQSGGCSSSKQVGKGAKDKSDSHFLVKEDEDVSISSTSSDSRTTLMIKNIPNNYSKEELLSMLDDHCIQCNTHITSDQPPSSYDFFHLPMNLTRKGSRGYAFVNMTSPQAVIRLYNVFQNLKWDVPNSKKICQVSYSEYQGLNALKEHFKDSRFPHIYKPTVFDPPRDGQRSTQAISIFE